MKRILLVLALFQIFVITNGQWAPIGAKWYYSSCSNGEAPYNSEYYLYESVLDTVVAGKSCKKLTVTFYKYFNGDTAYLPPIYTYQSSDTVYYFNTVYLKYFPLYIFNVQIGDTLTFHSPEIPQYPSDSVWQVIVDLVDYLIIDSDTMKRVRTQHYTGEYSFWGRYVEKLGCEFLMLHQPATIFPEWDGPMRCYSDSLIYYNYNTFPCDYRETWMTVKNEDKHEMESLIFPNPAINQLNIRSSSGYYSDYKIYSLVGILIESGRLQNKLKTISIDNYKSGIYYIELKTNNKIERKYFIVQK